MKKITLLAFIILISNIIIADIPKVYINIKTDSQGEMFIQTKNNKKIYQFKFVPKYTVEQFTDKIKGNKNGISFDFNKGPLFSINLSYSEELNKKFFSKNIRSIFHKYMIALKAPVVKPIKKNKEWLIKDKENGKQFRIKRNNKKLEVLDKLDGLLYYGFINFNDGRYHYPVYFKKAAKITDGKAQINFKKLRGKYDMVGWEKKRSGVIGYRIVNKTGEILFDGKILFTGKGPFSIATTITSGPFVNIIKHDSAVISFETNKKSKALLQINKSSIYSPESKYHEIKVTNLKPDTLYSYKVVLDNYSENYEFKTAPKPGSRKPFVFAYVSDSRGAQGGGERNFKGINAYIMKKVMALAAFKKVAFMQFSGDLISGYLATKEEALLEYNNWKHCIEPFAHYFPIYTSIGNHEVIVDIFGYNTRYSLSVPKFPFKTHSTEAIFSKVFVNPDNGPSSEDGSKYDPYPRSIDFPSYKENVYYYTYDNIAVVVLNSDYWYNPSLKHTQAVSGNLHAYIMDNQLKWFNSTLDKLQKNASIDFIFVTQHTPMFPNGGHSGNDMWYNGKNMNRAVVKGKKVDKGIIERRDEYLTILMKHPKVIAVLTGDEHNYNRMLLTKKTNIYPKKWSKPKITNAPYFRNIWQINNGAAGAPYYAQEKLPWSDYTKNFSTQNALVLLYVHGRNINMLVLNPDTLDVIDKVKLTD